MTVASRRPSEASYPCGICRKASKAATDTAQALLQLCQGCFEKRYAAGTEARLKAEAAEVARGQT